MVRESDGVTVLVEQSTGGTLRRALDLADRIDDAEALVPVDLIAHDEAISLILKDFPGAGPLSALAPAGPAGLDWFLPIAIALTKAVGGFHGQRLIHRNLSLQTVLCDPSGGIKLAGYGLVHRLGEADGELIANPGAEAAAYIAPEQTGRIARTTDHRSDLWQVGVILYRLLTGNFPFQGDDQAKLFHAIIALDPSWPDFVPSTLAGIVGRLLAKDPSDRYQSAFGLRTDLESCLDSLKRFGTIEPFAIGRHDIPQNLRIPNILYGREAELVVLAEAFERASSGDRVVLTVGGPAGIGKSSLADAIRGRAYDIGGHVASGKFDLLQRAVPYSAIILALRELSRQLLALGPAAAAWRRHLLSAIGSNGQIIINVVPEMELLLGKQPEPPQLGLAEADVRFNLVMQQFMAALARPDSPLVLFLDDLQWADSASLELIRHLLVTPELKYVLFIIGYRDNEIEPGGAIDRFLEEGRGWYRQTLGPLPSTAICRLLADTLHVEFDEVRPLADLVLAKTKGNAFFVGEFIKALDRKELLRFDDRAGRWRWDLAAVRSQDVTDNVLTLVSDRISSMPSVTVRLLEYAAAIGSRFDLDTLSLVVDQPTEQVLRDFGQAITESLVIETELPGEWRFAHDRIQDSAYQRIPIDNRPRLHGRIGSLLAARLSPSQFEERLFDIVNHLNIARKLRHTKQERQELTDLNLRAALKAQASAAYAPAGQYVAIAREMAEGLGDAKVDFDLAYTSAEIAYLTGDHEATERLARAALDRALTIFDRIQVLELLIQYYNSSVQYEPAVSIALLAGMWVDEKLPENPGKLAVLWAIVRVAMRLSRFSAQEIENLPEMVDPKKRAMLRIWLRTASSAYFTKPNLFALMMLRGVELSLRYGVTADSAFGFQTWGLIQITVFGRAAEAMKFAKISSFIVNRFQARSIRIRSNFSFAVFISPWKEPISYGPPRFLEGAAEALETGDLEYWSYCLWWYCAFQFVAGQNLEDLSNRVTLYRSLCGRHRQDKSAMLLGVMERTFTRLMKPGSKEAADAAAFDEETVRRHLMDLRDYTSFCYSQCLCLFWSWHERDYEAVLKACSEIERLFDSLNGQIWVPFYVTYQSLAYCELWPKLSQTRRLKARWYLARNRRWMQSWAREAPMNYAHRADLLNAESARLSGRRYEAVAAYDRAMKHAISNGFTQDQALISERMASLLAADGVRLAADAAWRSASNAWGRWHAVALKDRLSDRLGMPEQVARFAGKTTVAGIDNATVAKLAQAISGELVLDRLLERLLDLAMENAGARQSALVLLENGRLTVPTERSVEGGVSDSFSLGRPLSETDVPVNVVSYVTSTLMPVVIEDASGETRFGRCARWQGRGRLSVLCAPIIHQGRCIGALYLENDRTSGVFTAERVELLQVLASQAAIAIANARLFTELDRTRAELETYTHRLEQMVAERTSALEDRSGALQHSLEQLRAAQAQLVLREKLASLGQLTAGIAHEIKNPLNFVNNFSLLTRGLLDDFQQSLRDGDLEEQSELMTMIIDNLSKIEHHGRRADAIVRSMLLHSRTGSSEFAPTDPNRLVGDAMTLAYHGMRTQDGSFTCEMVQDFDPDIGQVEVVAQNLMRVLVNLLANAFYSLGRRVRESVDPTYRPILSLSTRGHGDHIEITIRDNGLGMTKDVREKLFTPFFTTKPPGEGTGLGLSLGYETIVTEHRGTIRVDGEPMGFAEFCISLPRTRTGEKSAPPGVMPEPAAPSDLEVALHEG